MRDRNSLPLLDGKTDIRSSLYRSKTLGSFPEQTEGIGEVTWPKIQVSVESKQEYRKEWTNKSGAMNLPQIDKRPILRRTDTPFKMDHRSPHSPDASSFLNVANMHLSPREKASEETKGKSDIKSANYLFYEPPFDDHVTAGIDMSQYAFRTTLERIPETDGERLLSGHGKRNSNSGDKKKQTSHTTQQKSEGHKVLAKVNQPITSDKKQMVCLRNLDLFAQQRQHFARNGHLTRVAFSYKMIQGDPRSLIEQTNQETVDSPTKAPQLRPNA